MYSRIYSISREKPRIQRLSTEEIKAFLRALSVLLAADEEKVQKVYGVRPRILLEGSWKSGYTTDIILRISRLSGKTSDTKDMKHESEIN